MEGPILSLCDVQTYLTQSVAAVFRSHFCTCPTLTPDQLPKLPELPPFYGTPDDTCSDDPNSSLLRCREYHTSFVGTFFLVCVPIILVLCLTAFAVVIIRICKKEAVFWTFIVGGRQRSSMRKPLLRKYRVERTKSSDATSYQDLNVTVEKHSHESECQELKDRTSGT